MKGTTKQELLVRHFRELIVSGFYKPGDLIPPEMTLAKEFAVNRMTVSKALSSLASAGLLLRRQGSGTFVAETEPAAAATTNFAVVSSLRTEDPEYDRTPYFQMLAGAEAVMERARPDCRITLTNSYPEFALSPSVLEQIRATCPAGVIYLVIGSSETALANMAALRSLGVPLVAATLAEVFLDIDQVGVGHADFGFLAADCLLRAGHRKLVYVLPEFQTSWIDRRIEGFKLALAAAGLTFSEAMLLRHGTSLGILSNEGRSEGGTVADAVLASGATGIMAVNDSYAVGMIEAFRRHGIDVPRQLSVVGADDDFHFRDRNLTTVRHPFREVGEAAAELLLEKLAGGGRNRFTHWDVRPKLVERNSVAAPATTTLSGEIEE